MRQIWSGNSHKLHCVYLIVSWNNIKYSGFEYVIACQHRNVEQIYNNNVTNKWSHQSISTKHLLLEHIVSTKPVNPSMFPNNVFQKWPRTDCIYNYQKWQIFYTGLNQGFKCCKCCKKPENLDIPTSWFGLWNQIFLTNAHFFFTYLS